MWLEGTGLEGRGWSVEVVIVHLAACKYCVASDSIAVLDFIIGGCHDQFTATAALSWPSTKHGGRCICQSAATTPGGHDCIGSGWFICAGLCITVESRRVRFDLIAATQPCSRFAGSVNPGHTLIFLG